jgi:hypothetical protein
VRQCAICELILVLMASCSAASAQNAPAVGFFMRFDSKPSPVFLRAMESELKLILLPAHLRLRWFMPNENSGDETWLGKMVLQFHGICAAIPPASDTQRFDEYAPRTRELADTLVEDGAILPYSETNCDSVRAFLDSVDHRAPGEETRLGVAMGRILAHELYHFLLQTREHSKSGIAKAVHSPSALLGRSLLFEHGELERIISLYTDPASPHPAGPPFLVPETQKISLSAN